VNSPSLHRALRSAAFATALLLPSLPTLAQTPGTTNPEALTLARQLVLKAEGDRNTTIQSISTPMVGMMQQMGVRDPAQAQALVSEAIIPVLQEHFDQLLTIEAQSYASVLSVDDLKAAIAFYDSPAGQDMIRAQPQLAQAKITGMTQWMGTLRPELQTKIQAMMQAHHWGPAAPQ